MDDDALGRPDSDDVTGMARALSRILSTDDADTRAVAAGTRFARRCGFDGFSCLVVRAGTTGTELVHHWTTAGSQWKAWYRSHVGHRVDPRIMLTHDRSIPLSWHHAAPADDPVAHAFEAEATANGIACGVAMSLQQPHGERAIVAWDCQAGQPDALRRARLRRELADLALIGCLLHEGIVRERWQAVTTSIPATLTRREGECLTFAARGLTSADIAVKCGIAERTVNFHIGNIVRKLGALNRGEAIARGVALDLVRLQR